MPIKTVVLQHLGKVLLGKLRRRSFKLCFRSALRSEFALVRLTIPVIIKRFGSGAHLCGHPFESFEDLLPHIGHHSDHELSYVFLHIWVRCKLRRFEGIDSEEIFGNITMNTIKLGVFYFHSRHLIVISSLFLRMDYDIPANLPSMLRLVLRLVVG